MTFAEGDLLQSLAEIMPTTHAYLLLYLLAKSAERPENRLTINYTVLGSLVGLTKATTGRALKKLEAFGIIKTSFNERRRVTIHVYNIDYILDRVKQVRQERDANETKMKPERTKNETLGSLPPTPPIAPDIEIDSNSTATPGTPPIAPPKRFIKPEAGEVTEYAASIGFQLDGQEFCDHYESKGWVVGKSPMKNWQAAVRTWKKAAGPEKILRPPLPKRHQEPDPEPDMTVEEMRAIREKNMTETIPAQDIVDLAVKLAGGKAMRR